MMSGFLIGLVYLMFFLSGAAALMYQVTWVRSLSLIFGGSHLAVATVLSVFMAGLAAGGYLVGKRVDRMEKPLRFYGILELGIALSALAFLLFIEIYPSIYVPLARGRDGSYLYLSTIRVLFAFIALIVPTILMGGTLPVLSRFVSGRSERLVSRLSFLYGFNTLGAVTGTLAAGFLFLPSFSATATMIIAVAMNASIGVASILLERKGESVFGRGKEFAGEGPPDISSSSIYKGAEESAFPYRLVLWGIGVSGFCALGYEVLWTRVLTMVVGASVYGFTTMLAAFLTGIALGSQLFGLLRKIFSKRLSRAKNLVFSFGIVQIAIGVLALLVSIYMRDLPANSYNMHDFFQKFTKDHFEAKQWANIVLAFLYMVMPALFMGAAFPIAGAVHAAAKKKVGSAVGEVLAYNTVGAILGAAASGYLFIYFFGIERSLEMLVIVNAGLGAMVISSLGRWRPAPWLVSAISAALLVFLAANPGAFRMWDAQYFATYKANQGRAFRDPRALKEALENTDVLYYEEGIEATVSSIKVKGGDQSFLTNGRVEASTNSRDRQVQYTLGHLPMLLAKDPKRALVVGLGSGMTTGAVAAHPGLEKVTLVELERAMLGVARTFGKYNHNVLDDPKLEIVINDGRNYLLTTDKKFDVITADPVHPWFRGAGYLYTRKYFKLASEHLAPGGVICQWLPIYELTVDDIKSVVSTFREAFSHTLVWLTYYDAVIVASNSPLVLDEAQIERRISVPEVKKDLKGIEMASARDFLSYFIMGEDGMRAFGEGGVINRDRNLYLEFSAPRSIGKGHLMRKNAAALAEYRESIIPYLLPPADEKARLEQKRTWEEMEKAARIYDMAHPLFLEGKYEEPQFRALLGELEKNYPAYAPARFLKARYVSALKRDPRLLKNIRLGLLDEMRRTGVEVSAVISMPGPEAAYLDFVDNDRRIILGESLLIGPDVEARAARFTEEVFQRLKIEFPETAPSREGFYSPLSDQSVRKLQNVVSPMMRKEE